MRRTGFLIWHRRLALAFAPLLLLQAMTGAVLLLREPLSGLLGPYGGAGAYQPVSAIVAAAGVAAAGHDGARVDRLFLPARAGDVAMAQRSDGTYAAVDPASALVVREGGAFAFPLEAALQWHYRLMWGTTGLAIVALSGIVLSLLAASGIGFWWPAKGRWGKALTINPRMPGRVRLRQWHRSGGVVIAVLVLLSAKTGVLLSGPDVCVAAALVQAGYRPTRAEIDAAVAAAKAQFPGAPLRDIRFPKADRLDINFRADDDGPRSVHVVAVTLSTAKVIKVTPAAHNDALWMKVLPLHTGESFGAIGLVLLLAEAVVLAALAVTGPRMWWQQRKLRK